MKLSKWTILVLGALILVVVAGIVLERKPSSGETSTTAAPVEPTQSEVESPTPVEAAAAAPEPEASVEINEVPAEATAEVAVEVPAPVENAVAPKPSESAVQPVTNEVAIVTKEVFGDLVLATVNGAAIRGKDIALFGETSMDKPLTMSDEMIGVLLTRAIERELIRQAAEVEGIVLTNDQRSEIDKIKETVLSRVNAPWTGAHQYNGTVEEQTRFEQWESESQMLAVNLLAKRGVSPPDLDVTEDQAKKYYDTHLGEFEALPAESAARAEAWKALDFQIRRRLAFEKLGAYNVEQRKYMDELRSRAAIGIQ